MAQGRTSDFLMGALTGGALHLVGALNFFANPKMTENLTLSTPKFEVLLHFKTTRSRKLAISSNKIDFSEKSSKNIVCVVFGGENVDK